MERWESSSLTQNQRQWMCRWGREVLETDVERRRHRIFRRMRVTSTRKIKKAWQTDAESFEPRCHNLKEKRDSCSVAWDLSKCIIIGLEFYMTIQRRER